VLSQQDFAKSHAVVDLDWTHEGLYYNGLNKEKRR